MKKKHNIKILIGPPLCGKTTWIKKNAKDSDLIISRDDIIMSIGGYDNYQDCYCNVTPREVNVVFNEAISEAIKNRKDIIIDLTTLKAKRRKSIMARVPKKEYNCIAVVFNWDIKILKERNIKRSREENKFIPESVIEDMVDSYQKVTEEEGFDKVISV